jgi:hypothetical protein
MLKGVLDDEMMSTLLSTRLGWLAAWDGWAGWRDKTTTRRDETSVSGRRAELYSCTPFDYTTTFHLSKPATPMSYCIVHWGPLDRGSIAQADYGHLLDY